ncbi:VapE domain-containing protein [Myroides odoratimimus]|uniref:VapE domain-containing protein n=1 Tax=Myroides odoratimimus TaxID=76832 RepID=UPI0025767C4E|nr:VapE domain-containing protein [Myroides odoratimimus]MDM1514119.1 virulence-associated E family protein [Myroides odoratimimus]
MEEVSVYDISSRKDSVYDKIHQELSKYFTIKFNEISLEFEIYSSKTFKALDFNESSLLIHLHREKINVSPQALKTYLKSHFIENYNPIIEYFEQLPVWDGKNHIKKYASYVHTDDNELFAHHLLKWAVRSVKTVMHTDQINKHCLILGNGEQNAGKSTYLENLCPKPLKRYYYENIGVSKDDRIKLCKAFIINIEELDILGKYDINSIKSIISQTTVNERLPYADKSSLLYRICSFVGSTNKLEFLNDETGSVRWIVFDVLGRINFAYSQEFDMDNFWAEAYHIYKHQPTFKSDLSVEEVIANEKRNERFTVQTVESEFVLRFYEPSENIEDFRTATEIVTDLSVMGHKLNSRQIGTALRKHGFNRIKHAKRQVYGYLAKAKFKDSPWGYNEL